jgi:hypothetical protein
MKERKLTKEEQILVLQTKIAERVLIIYTDESAILDMDFPAEYTKALRDEIENHHTIISEYREELKQLQK